jgi:hypothetical protein
MPYFALTDTDWSWDDQDEGLAIVVNADTPEEAVKKATEIHLDEYGASRSGIDGGITWKVAQLMGVGFQMVEWTDGVPAYNDEFTNYSAGSNGPLVRGSAAPASTAETVALWQRQPVNTTHWLEVEEAHIEFYRERGQKIRPLYAGPDVAP